MGCFFISRIGEILKDMDYSLTENQIKNEIKILPQVPESFEKIMDILDDD